MDSGAAGTLINTRAASKLLSCAVTLVTSITGQDGKSTHQAPSAGIEPIPVKPGCRSGYLSARYVQFRLQSSTLVYLATASVAAKAMPSSSVSASSTPKNSASSLTVTAAASSSLVRLVIQFGCVL